MHLQNRPYIYGSPYSKNEIDKFIKRAAKKGYTKVVDFSNSGKKYTVAKEMERITGKKFVSKSKTSTKSKKSNKSNKSNKSKKSNKSNKSNKSKKSNKSNKSKKYQKRKPKKILSLSARRSLKRRSAYASN